MISKYKNSYLKLEGVKEKDCYDALNYNELFKLIRYFQLEKRHNFQMFMECLQHQVERGPDWPEGDAIDLAKIKYWKNHLHYENLVDWCFKETTRRTKKSKYK